MATASAPEVPARSFEPGGLVRRFLAGMVDAVVPALALAAYALVAGRLGRVDLVLVLGILTVLILLSWGVYVWWCGGERAATPGMRLLDLELVDIATGQQVGWGRFFARSFVQGLLAGTGLGMVLMVIWLVADRHHRGWHDRAARGVVVTRQITERPGAATAPEPTGAIPVPTLVTVGLPAHLSGGPRLVPSLSPVQLVLPPPVEPRPVHRDAAQPPAPPTEILDPDRTRAAPDRKPGRPAEGWTVVFEDNRAVPLQQAVLVGRDPEPSPGTEATLVAVINTRMVSKTHLVIDRDAFGPFVIDQGSTNGSAVEGPDGQFQRCTPGERVRVEADRTVTFGDRQLVLRKA